MQLFPARGTFPAFLLAFQPFFKSNVLQLNEISQSQSSVRSCLAEVNEHLAGEAFAFEAIFDFPAFYAFSEHASRAPFVHKTRATAFADYFALGHSHLDFPFYQGLVVVVIGSVSRAGSAVDTTKAQQFQVLSCHIWTNLSPNII
jgi:hypothetical protein